VLDVLAFVIIVLIASILAGIIGSLLGLGGGVIIVPMLTLIFGLDIRYAIGASIVSVIATSSGAAVAFVRDRMTNVRIGMVLEMATTVGALSGAALAAWLSAQWLGVIFGLLLLYSAYEMFRKREDGMLYQGKSDAFTERFRLEGTYEDPAMKKTIHYVPRHLAWAFPGMFGAGVISGLLGIGSGSFKVLVMDMIMGLPIKVSSATSNLMIGVTAAASAAVYFMRGDIQPLIAAPVAIGVLIGAFIGAKLMPSLKGSTLNKVFVPVIIFVALEMIYDALKH